MQTLKRALIALKFLGALQLAACASTGATFRSGVGDAFLEHPPYYAGRPVTQVASDLGRIGHLPVAYQRGSTQAAIFDPRDGSGTPVDSLLSAMTSYLESLGVSSPLVETGQRATRAQGTIATPPDVRFGCIPDLGIPGNDCAERGDSALGRNGQRMQLSVGRPAPEWISWHRDALVETGSTRGLIVTLEVGQYLMRQEGLLAKKVLELGTDHNARLPWLTSLETPVTVLQLTAALVDADGRAVRIGAEGVYARRTPLLVSTIGAQSLLSDDDVRAVASARRDDLPAAPLAWQVAMRELVTRVTGRSTR